jgi:hypothetical protein
MNQDYESTKNTGGQMTPAPVKQPAPAAPLTEEQKAENTRRMLESSEDRQQARADAERKAAAGKAGKIALIFEVTKYLSQRGLVNAHSIWQFLSLNAKTPRPAGPDEFRMLLVEMVHTGRLQMTGGTPDAPLTKIFVKPLEYRID